MMKGFRFVALLFTHIPLFLFGQRKIEKYVAKQTVKISSIDPANTDYTDLLPIGQAIGNARVVMLGEQDHGDAAAFQAKARLVKFLHEKHGFNVLAFESDFFGLVAGYDEVLKNQLPIENLIEHDIYQIWTECPQFFEMKKYLAQTQSSPNKLHLAGVDIQFLGTYAKLKFRTHLDSLLTAAGVSMDRSYFTLIDTFLVNTAGQQPYSNKEVLNVLIKQSENILAQLKEKKQDNSFTYQLVASLHSFCKHKILQQTGKYADLFTERDKLMAANLAWLIKEKYKGEKVIVWAANTHLNRNAINDGEPKAFRHLTMGNYFTKQPEFSASTYVLGFTSFTGAAGRMHWPTDSIPSPEYQSLETWLNGTRHEYAFLDFAQAKKANESTQFFMFEIHRQKKSAWLKSYDGIFYIRSMFRCEEPK